MKISDDRETSNIEELRIEAFIRDEKHIKEGSIEFDLFCGLTEEEKEQLKKDIKPRPCQIIRIQGKCKVQTEKITEESK